MQSVASVSLDGLKKEKRNKQINDSNTNKYV